MANTCMCSQEHERSNKQLFSIRANDLNRWLADQDMCVCHSAQKRVQANWSQIQKETHFESAHTNVMNCNKFHRIRRYVQKYMHKWMKLTLKINYLLNMRTFLFVLIVLCFSSSHYFAIFIVTPLVCSCRWLCHLLTRRAKPLNKHAANWAFVQTSKSMKFHFAYEPHVLITFHVWTCGDAHTYTRFSGCDRRTMLKNSRNALKIQPSELSICNALSKSKEKLVWNQIYDCVATTLISFGISCESSLCISPSAFNSYWTNFTLIFLPFHANLVRSTNFSSNQTKCDLF